MPSGPKKRKAAKKKKEKQAAPTHHHHPHSVDDVHFHGDDDLKHYDDDKDSDAEEVGSPASQEHPDNHRQEETEKTKPQGSNEENKSSGEQKEDTEATRGETEEERDIEIEQEFEPADDELNSQSTAVEGFEPPKDVNGGVLQQNLDNESAAQNETVSRPANDELSSNNRIADNVEPRKQGNDGVLLQRLDEKSVAENETESKLESDDLNKRTATDENVEPQKEVKDETLMQSIEERSIVQKEADAKLANVELDDKNAIMEGDQRGVSQIEANLKTIDRTESKNVTFEPTMLLKESTDGDLSQSQNDRSHAIEEKIVLVDNSQFGESIQEVNSFSKGLTELTNSPEVGDRHISSVEPKTVYEAEKLKLCQEKIYGYVSVSAGSNGEMKENGEKEAILLERNGRMPPNCVNLGPDNRGTEAIVKKHETGIAPDAKISAACDVEDKLSVSSNVPATETANGSDSSNSSNLVEHLKDPEVPKSSDCQAPLIASAPRVVQRTSWMNCCGLLEVFSGSNR